MTIDYFLVFFIYFFTTLINIPEQLFTIIRKAPHLSLTQTTKKKSSDLPQRHPLQANKKKKLWSALCALISTSTKGPPLFTTLCMKFILLLHPIGVCDSALLTHAVSTRRHGHIWSFHPCWSLVLTPCAPEKLSTHCLFPRQFHKTIVPYQRNDGMSPCVWC